MLIHTWKKRQKTREDKNSYYVKGSEYFYFSKSSKAKSLEQLTDRLFAGKKVLFVYETLEAGSIYLIFTNSLRETLVINMENSDIQKVIAMLKITKIHTSENEVYVLSDSMLKDSIEQSGITVKTVNKRHFTSKQKKLPRLRKESSYIIMDASVIIGFVMLFVIKGYLFEAQFASLQTEYRVAKKEKQKINTELHAQVNELKGFGLKNITVAKDYDEIVKTRRNERWMI